MDRMETIRRLTTIGLLLDSGNAQAAKALLKELADKLADDEARIRNAGEWTHE